LCLFFTLKYFFFFCFFYHFVGCLVGGGGGGGGVSIVFTCHVQYNLKRINLKLTNPTAVLKFQGHSSQEAKKKWISFISAARIKHFLKVTSFVWDLYFSPNIIRGIKSWMIRWASYIMGRRETHTEFCEETWRKGQHGRPQHSWKDR
jgi:hypothetical protein